MGEGVAGEATHARFAQLMQFTTFTFTFTLTLIYLPPRKFGTRFDDSLLCLPFYIPPSPTPLTYHYNVA